VGFFAGKGADEVIKGRKKVLLGVPEREESQGDFALGGESSGALFRGRGDLRESFCQGNADSCVGRGGVSPEGPALGNLFPRPPGDLGEGGHEVLAIIGEKGGFGYARGKSRPKGTMHNHQRKKWRSPVRWEGPSGITTRGGAFLTFRKRRSKAC